MSRMNQLSQDILEMYDAGADNATIARTLGVPLLMVSEEVERIVANDEEWDSEIDDDLRPFETYHVGDDIEDSTYEGSLCY